MGPTKGEGKQTIVIDIFLDRNVWDHKYRTVVPDTRGAGGSDFGGGENLV